MGNLYEPDDANDIQSCGSCLVDIVKKTPLCSGADIIMGIETMNSYPVITNFVNKKAGF